MSAPRDDDKRHEKTDTSPGCAKEPEKARDLIGKNLRKVYDDVAAEPLPDRFVELLEKLKQGEGR